MQIFYLAVIGLFIMGVAIAVSPADSAVPPTRAFSKVVTSHYTYEAGRYNDILTIPQLPYAQISDSVTQGCNAGSAKNVTLNTNDSIYGFTHSTTSKTNEITIVEKGVYQIIAVPQVGEASVQASGIHNFWLTKNNIQVPNSNIKTTINTQLNPGDTITGTLNWIGTLNQGEIISFQQGCTDSDIGIIASASGVPPATPSVIISIYKIGL